MKNSRVRLIILGLLILVLVIILATFGYIYLENMVWLDALWLTVVSITTVGYGDIVPRTGGGRLFTLFLLFAGIGLYTHVITNIVIAIIEGQFKQIMEHRKMEKEISKLKDHVLICGGGHVGAEVARRLQTEKIPFLVIERDETRASELRSKGFLVLQGNATEDEVLMKARASECRAIIVALPDDAENLLVTLSVRQLNPEARVITRANDPGNESKLKQVGADGVVALSTIGGRRMALTALKPARVAFVDSFVHSNGDLEIEEISLPAASSLVGQSIGQLRLRSEIGISILAIKRADRVLVNLSGEEKLHAGDELIVFGPEEGMKKMEELI